MVLLYPFFDILRVTLLATFVQKRIIGLEESETPSSGPYTPSDASMASGNYSYKSLRRASLSIYDSRPLRQYPLQSIL